MQGKLLARPLRREGGDRARRAATKRMGYLDPPMDDTDNLRFVELETRLAYQDRTIEDLNEVVIALRADLDALRRELGRLERKIDQGGDEIGPANERPPHW